MQRLLAFTVAFIALTSVSLAETTIPETAPPFELQQLAFAILGTLVAARFAWQAFGRCPVTVADIPTFPRYMTNRRQFQIGACIFVSFACFLFLLLVFGHREVLKVISVLPMFSEGIARSLLDGVTSQTQSYLVVVAAVGAIYLYVLKDEGPWNVLLMMRDAIYRCISIPELASQIVGQIRLFLKVPDAARSAVVASTPGLVEQDFHKDPNTPDRGWAEICYMKWWLMQGHDARHDATFFAESSFGFDGLLLELREVSGAMNAWRSGHGADISLPDLFNKVKKLHNRFSQLVACYLIYRNASWKSLAAEAREFGISVNCQRPENPLKYWILYLVVLLAAVYLGVNLAAIGYDLAVTGVLNLSQDNTRTIQWMLYTGSNYGLAIIVVLLLRLIGNHFGNTFNISHLITYCWTFLIAFVVGPFGLALALHLFGPDILRQMDFPALVIREMKWGWGPAFVCVYISYYLDRQSFADMPDVDHSRATIAWRLLNALAFATGIVLLLSPSLMSIGQTPLPNDLWSVAKLRTVATGTTFLMTFALALAAQFLVQAEAKVPGADNNAPAAPPLPAGGV